MKRLPISDVWLIILFVVIDAIALGLPSIITPTDKEIDPEFMNGILAGSSILFGFWILLLERRKRTDWRLILKFSIVPWFLFCAISLIVAVYAVFLSALAIIPRTVALSLLMMSFTYNALFVLSSLQALLI